MCMTRLKSVQRAGPSLAGLMLLALLPLSLPAHAGEVEIVHVVFRQAAGAWSVDVTLKHADAGWDHYADAWRVVGGDGKVLGTRTLYHPHENEQPFTRSLGGVAIPAGGSKVYIEAHDKIHGWSPRRVEVDLSKAKGERFEVSR
jgi:hypothetical protein